MEKQKLTPYESHEFQQIEKWKKQEPNVASKAFKTVMKPVTGLINIIVPQKAIEGAITAGNGLAQFLTDKKDILRDGRVSSIEELRHKDLALSDKLADVVHNWADGAATAEGAGTGIWGLKGMVIDIPTLITMSFRVVHKIGLCYGYECTSYEGKQYVMTIISAASANTMNEKVASVAMLRSLDVMIAKTTWKKMAETAAKDKLSKEAAVITIKQLAERLGIHLTKKKVEQSIPVIGGVVGAAVNLAYINDVAWAARRMFQERWLLDNNKIIYQK